LVWKHFGIFVYTKIWSSYLPWSLTTYFSLGPLEPLQWTFIFTVLMRYIVCPN
jgi:hypothetical protein